MRRGLLAYAVPSYFSLLCLLGPGTCCLWLRGASSVALALWLPVPLSGEFQPSFNGFPAPRLNVRLTTPMYNFTICPDHQFLGTGRTPSDFHAALSPSPRLSAVSVLEYLLGRIRVEIAADSLQASWRARSAAMPLFGRLCVQVNLLTARIEHSTARLPELYYFVSFLPYRYSLPDGRVFSFVESTPGNTTAPRDWAVGNGRELSLEALKIPCCGNC